MIFNRFLKKKWQHKDSNVRIEAISNMLSLESAEQRSIICDLALNDDNENVRRAALIKLASYDEWLDHSQRNSMAKIKKYALSQIEAILTEQHTIKVSQQQKLDYIEQFEAFSFYETWLKNAEQSVLIIALFEKLARRSTDKSNHGSSFVIKPQLLISLFSQKQNEEVQRYIVEHVSELETLEKLAKKAVNDNIAILIKNKVSSLVFAKEQPIKLRKQINLHLAKLQALKDQGDYQQYLIRHEVLKQEWVAITEQNSCLVADEWQANVDKRELIEGQLAKLFIVKAEQYQQQQIAQQLEIDKLDARAHFDKALISVNQTLTTSIFENDDINENQYYALFEKLTSDIESSVLSADEKKSYLKQIQHQQNKLQQLPIIAESVSAATHLISKISQLALPTTVNELNERLPIYQQWLKDWKIAEKNSANSLPESIVNASKEIQTSWKVAIKPLEAVQKQEFSFTQKKLHDTKRLINSGKYNAAFGVYKKVTALFAKLSELQKQKLQREFDNVSEQIAELADWEHYIATPRKQKLLTQVKAIVEEPLDNPNEQAEKVKQFRKIWNSLGHADDESEQALNEEFNQLSERAFQPCRQFFAEQEKLREQHLIVRKGIISTAEKLSEVLAQEDTTLDHKHLDTELTKLQKSWQSAGQIDRALYKTMQNKFNNTVQPIKAAIKQFQVNNQNAKSALISQANELFTSEDISEAVNSVKSLQQQWKVIGYAGSKFENKLWQEFRKVNDKIFAKRDEKSTQENAALQTKKIELENTFLTLEKEGTLANTVPDLQNFLTNLAEFQNEIKTFRGQFKELSQRVDKLSVKATKHIGIIKQQAEQQQWLDLFKVIEIAVAEQKQTSDVEGYNKLSNFWQKKLKEYENKANEANRAQATLELEILAGIPSPATMQEQRMAAQVALMQDQMLSGANIDLNKRFLNWLLMGKLISNDLDMLNRIKPIFVA